MRSHASYQAVKRRITLADTNTLHCRTISPPGLKTFWIDFFFCE